MDVQIRSVFFRETKGQPKICIVVLRVLGLSTVDLLANEIVVGLSSK